MSAGVPLFKKNKNLHFREIMNLFNSNATFDKFDSIVIYVSQGQSFPYIK